MSHVFISYNKKHNREYARKLADKLLELGFDVWIDDLIDYGDDWWPVITKAIRNCKAFVPIMTPESDISEWVRREVMLADQLPRPIFPVLLAGNLINCDFWTMFLGKQHVDVRDSSLPRDDFYTRLEREVPRKQTRGIVINAPTTPFSTSPRIQEKARTLPRVEDILPSPFEWVEIPGGRVTLEDASHKADGTKGGVFEIAPFIIAKYPITLKQYFAFANKSDGDSDPTWWNFSQDAKNYAGFRTRPNYVECPDCPVTDVTWFDTIAFCRWLSAKSGQQVTLPTEEQWQRAAVGDTGWEYPWGNNYSKSFANTSESGKGRTVSVTQYLAGSPFGVMDMSGNAWEWCLNDWQTGDTDIEYSAKLRSVRGSAWDDSGETARASHRSFRNPSNRLDIQGFRIVLNL